MAGGGDSGDEIDWRLLGERDREEFCELIKVVVLYGSEGR